MHANRLLLNAYYNRDESRRFLREILVPQLAEWDRRGLIERSFYRRSQARGEHFRLFLTLTSPARELAAGLQGELAARVAARPSLAPDPSRDVTVFFKSFPNNSVDIGNYDQRDVLTPHEAVQAPLEALLACCSAWQLRNLEADWEGGGLALALTHGLLDGFQMDLDGRLACVGQCLDLFVPVSLGVDRSRKQSADEVRRVLQGVRRDFLARRPAHERWLEHPPAPVVSWVADLQGLCAPLGAACQVVFGARSAALAGDPQHSAASVLLTAFLGVIDQLLLDETEALATAYRLQKLYEGRATGAPA